MKKVWQEYFESKPYKALALGIAGACASTLPGNLPPVLPLHPWLPITGRELRRASPYHQS